MALRANRELAARRLVQALETGQTNLATLSLLFFFFFFARFLSIAIIIRGPKRGQFPKSHAIPEISQNI